ncbi:MAG: ATPase, partial [Bacteroidales bacterium]|nr:ATPase [Bacteroidales bacterium]
PLFLRSPGDRFNLANFMKAQLYAAVCVLKAGNEVLFKEEGVKVDRITGHGGLFKTPVVGQKVLAAALGSPISVMETAGEGGPWGMAILASYGAFNDEKLSLPDFLEKKVFAGSSGSEITPDPEDIEGFNSWIEKYMACIPVEKAAVEYKK